MHSCDIANVQCHSRLTCVAVDSQPNRISRFGCHLLSTSMYVSHRCVSSPHLFTYLLIYGLFNHALGTSDTSAFNAVYRKPSYNADLITSVKINVKNNLPNMVIHGPLNIRQQHTRHISTCKETGTFSNESTN